MDDRRDSEKINAVQFEGVNVDHDSEDGDAKQDGSVFTFSRLNQKIWDPKLSTVQSLTNLTEVTIYDSSSSGSGGLSGESTKSGNGMANATASSAIFDTVLDNAVPISCRSKGLNRKLQFAEQSDVWTHFHNVFVERLLPMRTVNPNFSVVAMGATGSGKSHTLFGDLSVPEQWGLIPRFLEHFFAGGFELSNPPVPKEPAPEEDFASPLAAFSVGNKKPSSRVGSIIGAARAKQGKGAPGAAPPVVSPGPGGGVASGVGKGVGKGTAGSVPTSAPASTPGGSVPGSTSGSVNTGNKYGNVGGPPPPELLLQTSMYFIADERIIDLFEPTYVQDCSSADPSSLMFSSTLGPLLLPLSLNAPVASTSTQALDLIVLGLKTASFVLANNVSNVLLAPHHLVVSFTAYKPNMTLITKPITPVVTAGLFSPDLDSKSHSSVRSPPGGSVASRGGGDGSAAGDGAPASVGSKPKGRPPPKEAPSSSQTPSKNPSKSPSKASNQSPSANVFIAQQKHQNWLDTQNRGTMFKIDFFELSAPCDPPNTPPVAVDHLTGE